MNTRLVNSAAGVINAALGQDRTAAGIALALESAQLLMSPERVAEHTKLLARVDEVERKYTFDTAELKRRIAELEAERHSTNEALDDAVQALRRREEPVIVDADGAEPTPLRWGLNDVMWGDDDSVVVMLSGPDLEPYWLELDQERAAVLRADLAGPEGAAGGAR